MNLREHIEAVTLRSGKQLEDLLVVESKRKSESEEKKNERTNQEASVGEDSKERQNKDQPSSSTIIPIPPVVLFPQRFK